MNDRSIVSNNQITIDGIRSEYRIIDHRMYCGGIGSVTDTDVGQ